MTEDAPQKPTVPPMLYVPVEYPQLGNELSIEFRRLDDGRLALIAYTALDRLVKGCGPNQPWVVIPASKLDEIDKLQPYDLVVLDVNLPTDQRHETGDAS